jgi:hypothetical protein
MRHFNAPKLEIGVRLADRPHLTGCSLNPVGAQQAFTDPPKALPNSIADSEFPAVSR